MPFLREKKLVERPFLGMCLRDREIDRRVTHLLVRQELWRGKEAWDVGSGSGTREARTSAVASPRVVRLGSAARESRKRQVSASRVHDLLDEE